MYCFVYGTLKKGFENHGIIAASQMIGSAETKPLYRLYDCGFFPCLVKSNPGNTILGEIYKISPSTLKQLDHLEGVPYLYKRENIELLNFDNPTFAYFFQKSVENFTDCGSFWPQKLQ